MGTSTYQMIQELKQTRIDISRSIDILKKSIETLPLGDAIVLQRTLDKIADSESFADTFRGVLRDDKLKSLSYNEKLSMLDANLDFSYETAGLNLKFCFKNGRYELYEVIDGDKSTELLIEDLSKGEVAKIIRDLSHISIISISRFQNGLSEEIASVTKSVKKSVLGNDFRFERLFHGIDKVLEFRISLGPDPSREKIQSVREDLEGLKFFRNSELYLQNSNLVVFYELSA